MKIWGCCSSSSLSLLPRFLLSCNTKRYKEIRKLPIWQAKDYTTGCFPDYDYIKNHYRLIAIDLSWQKVLDADPKAIHWKRTCWATKKVDTNGNATDAVNEKSIFVLKILEKIKERTLKFFQGNVTVFQKMANYE